ncbi:uncharacterized protein LOC122945763 [Bufo gargarizans]|uniref:uncharacterized protein LOC122945763 n=1 Tax=Bufo gargarizans TaxID=30331 RepID=UPI001CF41F4E|nr:uncharacterized protein LOC122945763 [Bufo gargarizans]
MDKLRTKIKHFTFHNGRNGSQGFNRVLIQLFGLMGHGKSSFINSCLYVWEDGDYQNWAQSAVKDGGCTMDRLTYPLTSNITLVDNRGYAKLGSYETGEIFAQLGNLLPLGNTVEWSKGFGLIERIVRAETKIKPSDFIVPVFVYSVKTGLHPPEDEEIKHLLLNAAKLTGINPIVVLTYKTSGSLAKTMGAFRNIGAEKIFAFENYTQEDSMKTRGRHEEVLNFLSQVIEEVLFRIDHSRDPKQEMKERKQFVLNYVHDQEKKLQQDHLDRQRVLDKAVLMARLKRQQEMLDRQKEKEKKEMEDELQRKQEELERKKLAHQAIRDAELRAQIASNERGKRWNRIFR